MNEIKEALIFQKSVHKTQIYLPGGGVPSSEILEDVQLLLRHRRGRSPVVLRIRFEVGGIVFTTQLGDNGGLRDPQRYSTVVRGELCSPGDLTFSHASV